MANNIGALAIAVLKAIPLDGGDAETALIHSAVSTIDAAQGLGRDPTPGEWDAIMQQISDLTGTTMPAASVDPTVVPAGATADALDHPAEPPVLTPEQQQVVDDHPATPPSAEASQANPVDPATGVAAGTQPVTPAPTGTDAAAAGSTTPASTDTPVADKVVSSAGPLDASSPPSDAQSAFDAEDAKAKADLADFEAKAKADFNL